MTFDEWRTNYASYGLPVFIATQSPSVETNTGEDLFSPSLGDSTLGKAIDPQGKDVPPTYDGITISDMKDDGFSAMRFAPNKLAQMDAALKYQRGFVKSYNEFDRVRKKSTRRS